MEETVVRDKAVESACVVIGLMQGGQQEVSGSATANVVSEPLDDASIFQVFHL